MYSFYIYILVNDVKIIYSNECKTSVDLNSMHKKENKVVMKEERKKMEKKKLLNRANMTVH